MPGAASFLYAATASTTTGITYSLDAASLTAGNTINSATGNVTYVSTWSGTSIITASAAGCNGPTTSTHTVTIVPTLSSPVFTSGSSSIRCQGAATINYAATASNSTGIGYTLDVASLAGGNSINSGTGDVTYAANWSGSSVITVYATGCNGPKSATHTVTVTASVSTPAFALGAMSTRQQGGGTFTYSATATPTSGITYSLDATSLGAGNVINPATGAVTFSAAWSGSSTITASAAGCNGPTTATHVVRTNAAYVTTPLYLSDPSQALDRIDPVASGDVTTASSGLLTNMPVVIIDATSTGYSASPPSTIFTVTHTTGTGGNRLMLVGISQKNKAVSSVTYGGVPLTLVGDVLANTNARVHLYKLINPPSGTADVVVTMSAIPDKGIIVGVTTFSGVNQTTPLGTFAGTENKNTTPSVAVVSAAGELVYDVVSLRMANLTVGSGQNEQWNFATGSEMYGGGSTAAGAASVSANWTASASQDWSIAAVSIKPAPATSNTIFTQAPALCSALTLKSGVPFSVTTHVRINTGTMPANPNITAQLKYGATSIITLSNPTYYSAQGILVWSGSIGSDVTVPSGQAISLVVNTAQAGVDFYIDFDSQTKPSKIDLPTSTYVTITSLEIYDAPYPGGRIRTSSTPGITNYIRTVAVSPFGSSDVTGVNITITPNGVTNASTEVATTGCGKIYEYPWLTPSSNGKYTITASALQGYENTTSFFDVTSASICSVCPPVAVDDSAAGAGGAPLLVDVLANDYDPNNNMNPGSLIILTQPSNGDAILSNGKIVYIPNGTYTGVDQFTYQVCDSTSPIPLCAVGTVKVNINPTIVDPCSEATQSHTFFVPYPEADSRTALIASSNTGITINDIHTIISLKMPYPNMKVVWDHWEDGYEINPLNPLQSTTLVWGDGNPYNGMAPGYPDDIIPAGGGIVLDNTIPANPRLAANIFFDGRDKIFATGQISMTQVSGEPSIMGVQCMKTDVASVNDFGKSFTIPVGQDYPSQDFAYSALFIRASEDSTIVNIDKNNDGIFETTTTLNQGQSMLVNGGVKSGAKVTGSAPIGVDLHFGGIDGFSSREVPLYPSSWYSHTYYSPVPTTGSGSAIKDTAVVMLYNNLNRSININWSSGVPSSGTITLPAKTVYRFPLAVSQTAAYKFDNPTGESFTAIEIVDSYTPGGGGNSGSQFDWAFNLIAEERLTTFATTAWAPGSTDGTRNDNPIWVTPSANTTIYVKYDGDLTSGGSVSPLGLHYDVSYPLNALNHKRLRDPNDNDQSGLAVFTVDGTKLAAVYGEDPQTATTANPSWDVGATIRPFCALKLIFANDDYAYTITDNPVTIPVLRNDYGFSSVIDPATLTTSGLLQPKHGAAIINSNGTILYVPDPGYQGLDTFEYRICSTPSPIVCDMATVYVTINSCPSPINRNLISGQVFVDHSHDGFNNDGGEGFYPARVYFYTDGNCNSTVDAYELTDSVDVDSSGTYQFITYPEKTVSDNFDGPGGTKTCANGTDGNSSWVTNWADAGDPSTGFCVTPASTLANTDAEIVKDGAFGYAIRLKDNNVSATRIVNIAGANYAFLTFSYRRATTSLAANEDVIVQVSKDGTTFNPIYTIKGDATMDANYVTIYNQDLSAYASSTTYIRFLTNNNVDEADSVFIDNVSIRFLKYPQCYIVKLAPASVPSGYVLTTAIQKPFSVASSGSCYAPYDFGVATQLATLPANAMPLTGIQKQSENRLYWSTESEMNSDHFEVENSLDGGTFTKIATVSAKGNSSLKSYYNYVHQNPAKATNYYRIKLVYADGRTGYSNIISLKPGNEGIQMTVMPNPFNSSVTVAATFDAPGKATIAITDVYGKTVKTMNYQVVQGFNAIKINGLEGLASGTYVLQIKNQEQVATSKIVKIK